MMEGGGDGELTFVEDNPRDAPKRCHYVVNIPGQRYTLGSVYKSREEQGEFIFCENLRTSYSFITGDSHCEIICDDEGKFWVSNLQGHETWINEEKVDGRAELKFGDRLVLGDLESGDSDNYMSLIFKKRQFRKIMKQRKFGELDSDDEYEDESEKADFTIGIHLILSKIMSFLPVKDIMSTRLVCHDWQAAGQEHFKRKATINLSYIFNPSFNPDHMMFSRFLTEMKDTQVSSAKMGFHFGHGYDTPTHSKKLVDDVKRFAENDQFKLKKLCLGAMKQVLGTELELCLILLKKYAATVEDLELIGGWQGRDENAIYPVNMNFPKLRRLKLDFAMVLPNKEGNKEWHSELVSRVTKVSALYIGYSMRAAFLDELLRFDNLQDLTLEEALPEDLAKLQLYLKKSLKALTLESLAKFKKPEDFFRIELLLETHAKTLESLKLHLLTIVKKGNDPKAIKLPIFPRLKSLEFCLSPAYYRNEFLSFILPYEGNVVDYSKSFPVLQRLRVMPQPPWEDKTVYFWSQVDSGGLYQLFPTWTTPKIICKTVRYLDIPEISAVMKVRRYGCARPTELERGESIVIMFPNATRHWLPK